jgi:two-component system, NarL family, response regulator NreC
VLKQSSSTVLLTAIRAVCGGQKYLDPAVTAKVVGGYVAKGESRGTSQSSYPSDREKEVLRLIALGYSNKQIATRMGLSVKTVEVHKANAMRKLNMRGRIDIVKFVFATIHARKLANGSAPRSPWSTVSLVFQPNKPGSSLRPRLYNGG